MDALSGASRQARNVATNRAFLTGPGDMDRRRQALVRIAERASRRGSGASDRSIFLGLQLHQSRRTARPCLYLAASRPVQASVSALAGQLIDEDALSRCWRNASAPTPASRYLFRNHNGAAFLAFARAAADIVLLEPGLAVGSTPPT